LAGSGGVDRTGGWFSIIWRFGLLDGASEGQKDAKGLRALKVRLVWSISTNIKKPGTEAGLRPFNNQITCFRS